MIKNIFDKLSDIEEQRQNEIAQQKKEGVPLVVYNSTFVPEEIIRAAGANTYLLCRGGESAPAAAAINDTLECINPLARASVSYIAGKMDSIASKADLVVTAFSDSHMSRMSELLEYKGINVLKVGVPVDWQRSISFDYYLSSLRTMQRRVEELTGEKTDIELARENFARSNRIKACSRRIKELRKADSVPLRLEDVVRLHHMGFLFNTADAVDTLEAYVDELGNAPSLFDKDAPRLLMIMRAVPAGDYSLLKLIDETGCPVVAEVLDECACVSDSDVELEGDLLQNFARSRYSLALPLNSFQPSWKIRYARICELISEYRISGVIWYQLAFDEIYDMEYTCVSKWLGEKGMPVLKIETDFDYSQDKLTAKRNQINSFINRIKKGK